MAALEGNVEVIEKVLECANEKLKSDEINNRLLLSKDRREQTVWNVAADESNTDISFLIFCRPCISIYLS